MGLAWARRAAVYVDAMKVLVAAASRYGATTEIADALAQRLGELGHECDQVAPRKVTDLTQYDAAVLASGVYLGRWLRPARKLLSRHRAQLNRMPVWLISSGPTGDPLRPADDPVNVPALMRKTGARKHVVLPGRIDNEHLRPQDRLLVVMLQAPQGDYRDWQAIDELADEIHAELTTES